MSRNYDEPEHVTALRENVRRFLDRHAPREKARQWDRENIFPRDVFAAMRELGIFGMTVPEEYGGSGIDISATMAVIEELARRSTALACPYIMAVCYAGMNLAESGSAAQRQALLPKLAAGELIFAYGLSEPNVGGDLAMVETTARREGNHIVLNGAKRWCTGAHIADYIFCLVRTGPREEKYRNLSILLVPPNLPGITITPLGHLGIRGVETKDVTFDDVTLSDDAILGGPDMWNKGWSQLAGRALEVEKLELSAVALGLSGAAVEDAWAYAEMRTQFGKPIGQHQVIRHALVDARTKLQAMRHMLFHAAWLADQNRPCSVESSMAKLFCCEGAADVTLACQRVAGAYGLSDGMDFERYVRDAISLPIVGGSSNMQRNNIANRLKLAERN
ncbi:MAG TPA: acyl-CoA dehydrogenase family protein [Micropepsaceae bacterium]|nr:acyl-CoA dehydrogenase family protein [Micropepsaceae bacterium]